MSTLASTYWSDISGHFITCPTICHYNLDLLTVHDIFSDNKVLFTRIYQDPSMKILSWMAIGRGKKHTLINTPSRSSSDDQASS